MFIISYSSKENKNSLIWQKLQHLTNRVKNKTATKDDNIFLKLSQHCSNYLFLTWHMGLPS